MAVDRPSMEFRVPCSVSIRLEQRSTQGMSSSCLFITSCKGLVPPALEGGIPCLCSHINSFFIPEIGLAEMTL